MSELAFPCIFCAKTEKMEANRLVFHNRPVCASCALTLPHALEEKRAQDKLEKDGTVDKDTFVLLELPPQKESVFFIVPHKEYGWSSKKGETLGTIEYEHQTEYLFEEHSCPTNWLRDIQAVIHGPNEKDDADFDPHGLIKYVESIYADDLPDDINDHMRYWLKNFPDIDKRLHDEWKEAGQFKCLEKQANV